MRRKIIAVAFIALLVTTASFAAGYFLGHPYHRPVGQPPADLPAEAVSFPSGSGTTVRGWLLDQPDSRGVVILMHGVRATRTSMLNRARFLHAAGYAVLLFDFQAHGESRGRVISFGFLESRDAAAAVAFARNRFPDQRIGVIGSSLGGAAALLGEGPIDVDALVLEAVYPTVDEALSNRLRMGLGTPGTILGPLLTLQLKPRLGLTAADLRPIDRIHEVTSPLLIINGSRDRHTTPEQALALFQKAAEPKSIWIVKGAGHLDLDRYAGREYERRILSFFEKHLASGRARAPQSKAAALSAGR